LKKEGGDLREAVGDKEVWGLNWRRGGCTLGVMKHGDDKFDGKGGGYRGH
jgi:hypothetical protein